jgi:hypothetical protein
MQNDRGEMEQVDVELGVDNDNYVQIVSGVAAGDTVYKAVASAEEGGGLFSVFSSLQEQRQSTTTVNSNFDPSNMPQDRTFYGDGSYGGGRP